MRYPTQTLLTYALSMDYPIPIQHCANHYFSGCEVTCLISSTNATSKTMFKPESLENSLNSLILGIFQAYIDIAKM